MKIQAINTNTYQLQPSQKQSNAKAFTPPVRPSIGLPSFYYRPIPKSPTFKGLHFENTVIKTIDKKFQGKGLFKPGGWRDFSKVGWEHLSQETLDIRKATDNEVAAFWEANALAETHDSTWVRRYNKYNVPAPLAVHRTLVSKKSEDAFFENLTHLLDKAHHHSLDVPITDKGGKLCLDCVVFDTETTGLNIQGPKKPLDRIVQIGAIQLKGGKIVESSAYNQLLNPEMPIPEVAAKIHGITDEMVKDKPPIEAVLKHFNNDYLNKKNGIIVAYNSKFDMTILNNAIQEHNGFSADKLKEKQSFKVLDPFILIQRIHPYLGARKKLGEQYKYLFCKNLDNAHDAFADVKGTIDVLKYTLYHLSEKRKDKSKPLTLRDVLIFQNGVTPPNIDLPLDHKGCNARVNFESSYRQVAMAVDNYFLGYKLSGKTLKEIAPDIGPINTAKLKKDKLTNVLIDLNPEDGHPINPEEVKMQPKKGGIENAFYTMERNFKKVLGFSNLEPYNGKSVEEITDLITEQSEHYLNESSVDIWIKNPNPADIAEGNDLPDIKIARRVMQEQ